MAIQPHVARSILAPVLGWLLMIPTITAAADGATSTSFAYTPESVAITALRNRLEIVASRARASALRERPAIVGALEDPMISPSIDHYPTNMMDAGGRRYDWSVSIEQKLPSPRLRSGRRRAARAEAAGANFEAQRIALDVAAQSQRAFFMLWERQQMRAVLERQLALARQVAASAAARYAIGVGTQSDLLRAELETSRIEAEQRSLVFKLRAAEAMLNVSMGLQASSPIESVTYEVVLDELPSAAFVEKAALDARPELGVSEAEVERATAEIDVMRSMSRPMTTIRVGRASTMAEGPGTMLMVGVSVPIWRDRVRAGISEARWMERMARADLEAMRLMVAGEVRAARDELESVRATIRALERDVVPGAEAAVDASLATYSVGDNSLAAVMDALAALWRARGELVMARARHGLATIAFDRALGRNAGVEAP